MENPTLRVGSDVLRSTPESDFDHMIGLERELSSREQGRAFALHPFLFCFSAPTSDVIGSTATQGRSERGAEIRGSRHVTVKTTWKQALRALQFVSSSQRSAESDSKNVVRRLVPADFLLAFLREVKLT